MLRFTFVPVLALVAACGGNSTSATSADAALLLVEPEIVIRTDSVRAGDAYEIVGSPFAGSDTLHVTVRYGGGCARHVFSLHASHVFMESEPVQSPIALLHDANGDTCLASFTRELRFDLTALRDTWRRSYQRQNGAIVLRLRGHPEGILYTF